MLIYGNLAIVHPYVLISLSWFIVQFKLVDIFPAHWLIYISWQDMTMMLDQKRWKKILEKKQQQA